jgi:hypothetical protein
LLLGIVDSFPRLLPPVLRCPPNRGKSRGPTPGCFNGAVTLRSRKLQVVLCLALNQAPLQWGRDLAVTETLRREIAWEEYKGLQWGRDLAVTETSAASVPAVRVHEASMGP